MFVAVLCTCLKPVIKYGLFLYLETEKQFQNFTYFFSFFFLTVLSPRQKNHIKPIR